jgi:uncharacterized protein YifE (UPF0438 family)
VPKKRQRGKEVMGSEKVVLTITILVLISLGIWAYWGTLLLSSECLDRVGESFCNALNMSYSDMGRMSTDFSCYKKDAREYYEKDYNYLDSEEQSCVIKERKTFKFVSQEMDRMDKTLKESYWQNYTGANFTYNALEEEVKK